MEVPSPKCSTPRRCVGMLCTKFQTQVLRLSDDLLILATTFCLVQHCLKYTTACICQFGYLRFGWCNPISFPVGKRGFCSRFPSHERADVNYRQRNDRDIWNRWLEEYVHSLVFVRSDPLGQTDCSNLEISSGLLSQHHEGIIRSLE